MDNVEILMVEDDKDAAELIVRALRKVNCANNLLHLIDGAEALDFIFARGEFVNRKGLNIPKVILLDIKMPKVDGIEVLRQLKSNKSTRKIPVVIMTSSTEEREIIKSYDLGANSFVVKPVEFVNFSKAIAELGLFWLLTNQGPG